MKGDGQPNTKRRRIAPWAGDSSPSGRLICGLSVLVVLGVLSAFLAVNVFPVPTNDSIFYLEHSLDLVSGGWVEYGYRQVGYPFVLAVVRTAANLVGADPLLAVAMLQRLLLVLATYLAWRFWRWWALPAIVLFVCAETLAYTNFLLTEGLAVPLGILLVFPTVRFVELARVEQTANRNRRLVRLAVLIVALVLILFSLRFTFAVFGAVPLVLALVSWRISHRAVGVWMLGSTVVLMAMFALLASLENQREEGVFGPSVAGHQVRYYYAWQQVFTVHPENRHDPALSEFYDEGFVHQFPRDVDALELSPERVEAAYDTEIEDMLEAAGISPRWSQVRSSFFGLAGGRLHDTGGGVAQIVAAERLDVDELIYMSQFADREGPQVFADRYSSGELVEAVITDPIGVPSPFPLRSVIRIMLPVALVVMVFGLTRIRTRPFSAIGLLVVAAFALGMGLIRADNLRFLLPTSAFGVTMASGVLATSGVRSRGVNAPDHDDRGAG